MPPTLFQLPNLYHPVASEIAQEATDLESALAKSEAPAFDESEVESPSVEGEAIDANQPAPSTRSVLDARPAKKPILKTSDWMQTVRANSTVLALVVAVILAALFVGHRSKQRAQQANRTIQANTDAGEEMKVEASTAASKAPTAETLASSKKLSAPMQMQTKSIEEVQPTAHTAEVPPSLRNGGIEAKTVSATTSHTNPYAIDMPPSLPATDSVSVAALPSAPVHSHAQTDQPAGLDFAADAINASLGNASLGALDVTPASEGNPPTASSPRYPQTPTPRGISNWSSYLPPSP